MATPEEKMSPEEQKAYDKALKKIEACRERGEYGVDLDLSGLSLTRLPPEVVRLMALTTLYLHNNLLTSLPANFGRLTYLRGLFLHNNLLTSLPANFSRLRALKRLNLSSNQLTSLPADFGRLKALTQLNISSNQLTSLPADFSRLRALRELYLSNNQLTSLPSDFGRLRTLVGLFLSNNQLTSLPAGFGKLKDLTELFLDCNKLTSLPPDLGRLIDFNGIFLHGNPGLNLPPEILGPSWRQVALKKASPASPKAILDYYFRNLAAKVKRPILEAKVILVGWGKVGKTSLRRRLTENSFDGNEGQTQKIEITPWPVEVGPDRVKLHVWDFGGQEIMHATHQFFLTKRSLYVLVVAGREKVQGAQEAEYWLRLIGSFGGCSPVLVVLNRQNGCAFDLNRQDLMDKYPFIRGFVQTDCDPPLRLEELKEMILTEVDKLPDLRTEFDERWLAIKDAVTDLKLKGERRMPVAAFKKLCVREKETEAQWQQWLLGFLHDLGTVVCFHEDARLANDGVLDPQWVVDGIYAVLNEKTLKGADGQFKIPQIRALLPEKDYTDDDVRVLVELMEKFELCFRLQGHRDILVVPELMTEQEADWRSLFPEPEKCLRFQLKYNFLPEGLIPRFVVATHELSRAGERWRSGVILHQGRNMALVRGDNVNGKVSILVTGPEPTRRDLLAVIRNDFTKINRSISGLVVDEMVPVPGLNVDPINYEDLVAAECDKPRMEHWPVRVNSIMHHISISLLLNGIEPKEKRKARAKEIAARQGTTIYLGDHIEGDKTMSEQKIEIGGNAQGSSFGDHSPVTTQDSFNQTVTGLHGPELADLFEKLTEQMPPLKDEMTGKNYKVLEGHIEAIKEEAKKPEPDKRQLSVSGKGLIEAAKTVKEIAAPVIATAGLILKFLGVPLP